MASDEELVSILNELIETCRDGQEGFRTAAGGVKSLELKELFERHTRERASFVGELQDEVRRLGGDPEQTGSLVATLHRGWMGLRAALEGGDDRAIVSECERGEDAALSTYRAALGKDMPAGVRAIVERQFAGVKKAHDHIRDLERRSGAGAMN